ALDFLNERADKATSGFQDFIALDEAHFKIDLRKFGLAISARVFIAKAFAQLEIALAAAHHENLLEDLRTLWQSVPLARVNPRRQDVVAGAFGRGLDQERRFDFEKALRVKIIARDAGHFVPGAQGFLHLRTA